MKNIKSYSNFLNEDKIQDKADAINHYGRLAKEKNISELAELFVSDREYNMGEYKQNYVTILKKYGLYNDVMKQIEEYEEDSIDPAGGHGLHSHENKNNSNNMRNLKRFFEFINENIDNSHSGRYVRLEVVPSGLMLHLTEEGRTEAEENKDDEKHNLSEMNFYEYFEDIQVNSEWLYHFDMGEAGFGLTSAPGFTDGYYMDDDGKLTDKGHEIDSQVYWFPNYAVESFTETLLKDGKVFFTLASDQSAGSDESDSPNG